MAVPKINEKKCTNCGTCVETCPVGVFEKDASGKVSVKNPQDCIECKACEVSCPAKAITVE